MKTLTGKVVPIILVGGLFGGCVSNQPMNDAADSGQSDADRTKTEGAVFGAVLGGLIGLATGDRKGAVIGAALGAGAGYLVGNEIAQRKQAYATDEAFLDAEIARTAEFNETARAYNQRLHKEIAEIEKESTALRARYDSGKSNRQQLLAKQDELEQKLAKSREFQSTLQQEFDINSEVLAQERRSRQQSDPYLVRLERENRDLKAQIDQLRLESEQLAQINERLSV